MGAIKDITSEKDATASELRRYLEARNKFSGLDNSNTFSSSNPNHRLFFYAFDGTRNDRKNPDPGNVHTNPDLLETMVIETSQIYKNYDPGVATRNEHIIEHYYEAVSGAGSLNKAEDAYHILQLKIQEWHKANPNIEVHVATVGFSRGTGSQRHFANLVHDNGIYDSMGGGYLIKPGDVKQDVMLIYDSVVTGQKDLLDLGIPSSVQSAIHFTADHENRINFDCASIIDPLHPDDLGILETGLPGAHSDVGGNYDYGGLSARSLELGHEILKHMGVPLRDIPTKYGVDPANIRIHDSGNIFEPAHWENGEREVDYYHNDDRILKVNSDNDSQNTWFDGFGNDQRMADNPTLLLENIISFDKDTNTAPTEDTILGYTLEEWQAINDQWSDVETVEDAGAEMSSLIAAYEEGDDWEIFESSIDLLSSVESLLVEKLEQYPDLLEAQSSNIQGGAHLVNAVGSFKDLQDAIESGDDWQATESAALLVESGFDGYNTLNNIDTDVYDPDNLDNIGFSAQGGKVAGAASAVVSLAITMKDLADALDSGDEIEAIDAALEMIENGTTAYVEAAEAYAALSGTAAGNSMQICSTSLPAIGAAVGIGQGVLTMLDGDVEGGAEQIALTTASYYLLACGPYGWLGAIALQLGSATRNCDGRLIDKENIEDFAEDVGPGGEAAVKTTIASIEKPSELLDDVSDGVSYLSGFNFDMYEDIGVEVPEDMDAEFAFNQTVFEANNPLRYAEYFTDLEDLSLSDIWDSTYITQTIVDGVDQIKNSPEFLLSTITDSPALVADLFEASLKPENIFNIFGGIFGDDDPPSATASFTLDENGGIVMAIGGDSEMQETAALQGSQLTRVMENYQANGGRLLVDGSLPSFTAVSGEDSRLDYSGTGGGRVSVLIDDPASLPLRLQTVLYGRDHGERVDTAVKLGTNSSGEIDLARVDEILAGYGFKKDGMTYTTGEVSERECSSAGSGVFVGGGNVGPEGEHFTAGPKDISSLPLRPEQLPSQKMGRISRVIGLSTLFGGSGSELLAMAMADPGGTTEQNLNHPSIQLQSDLGTQESIRPLSPFEYIDLAGKGFYGANLQSNPPDSAENEPQPWAGIAPAPHSESVQEVAAPPAIDLHHSISDNYGGAPVATPATAFKQQYAAEPEATMYQGKGEDNFGVFQVSPKPQANAEELQAASPVQPVASKNMARPDDVRIPDGVEPEINYGSRFVMTEDAILRLLPFQLAETNGLYSLAAENDTFLGLGSARGGRVWQEESGEVRFAPDKGFVGTAIFTYTVQTPSGSLVEKVAAVTVENVNSGPLLQPESFQLQEGDLFFLDGLLANDHDPDGDPLIIDHVEGFDNGKVTLVDGNLAFIPNEGYHGEVELTYWVQGGGYPVPSTAILHYSDVNRGVATTTDRFLTLQGQDVSTSAVELLANDTEHDGEGFVFTGLGESRHGKAALDDMGRFRFIPDSDYFGTEAGFSYSVEDDSGNITFGWAGVEVLPVQSPPQVVANHGRPISSNEILTFTPDEIASFVHDPEGDLLRLDMISNVTGGKIIIENGTYAFIPDQDFIGTAFFNYRVNDGNQGVATGYLEFEVQEQLEVLDAIDTNSNPEADEELNEGTQLPPVAGITASAPEDIELPSDDIPGETGEVGGSVYFQTLTLETNEEQPLSLNIDTLLSEESDQVDDALFFGNISEVFHGEVRLDDSGILEFIPHKDYFGDEAGFSYTVTDGKGWVESCFTRVKVANINDVPVITADRLLLAEDQTIRFTTGELSKFLYDADKEPVFLESMIAHSGGRISQSDSVFSFTPDPDFYGEAVLSYIASDSAGEQVSGQVFLGITPVNDVPYVLSNEESTGSTIEEQELLFSVDELMAKTWDLEDGEEVKFGGIESSIGGNVYVDEQGVHFVPHKDFFGIGSFRYKMVDKEGGIGVGTVRVAVEGTQDTPVAYDDNGILAWSNNGFENVYLPSALLANDVDADLDSLTLVGVGEPNHGSVSLDSNGFIRYTAAPDCTVGIAQFSYTIADTAGNLAAAVAEIEVHRNNSPDVLSELLVSTEDTYTILEQQQLLANDYDFNGDSLRITAVGSADHCDVELLADGRIVFIPDLNFNNLYPGQASFAYTVSDGISEEVTGVAHFVLAPENDKPIAVGDHITGAVEDNSFSFQAAELLANDTDVEMLSPYERDAIFFGGVLGADHGSLSYDPDSGSLFYVPTANFNGVETFRYLLVDSQGAQAIGTSEIHVQPVNDNPVAQEDVGSPAEETIWNYYSIAALVGNDYDVDGDRLSITNPYLLEGRGSVRVSGDKLAVQPVAGEDKIVVGYTVTDGKGGEASSKLTIPAILEHNYAPTFSGLYSVGWKNGYTVWFNFHANDRNGGNSWGSPGDIVGISASAPSTGKVTQQSDNPYTFKFKGDVDKASVVLTVVDQAGATGSIFVQLSHLARVNGTFHYSPVVLDLDGDGIELVDLSHNVHFDWNLDGKGEKTGWVGPDDGLLVYDYDGDRQVNFGDELSLTGYQPGAMTDLEGLKWFDSDGDNVFSGSDQEWSSFGVWQDANSNGITDSGEFISLTESGICSIALQSDGNYQELNSNIVYGETVYHLEDGTTGIAADVGLNGEEIVFNEVAQSPDQLVDGQIGEAVEIPEEQEGLLIEDQSQVDTLLPPDEMIIAESPESPSTADTGQAFDLAPIACEEEIDSSGVSSATDPVTALQESTGTAPVETDPDCEIALPEEAELNHLYLQLVSDMAAFGASSSAPCNPVPMESTGNTINPYEDPLEVEAELFTIM